MKDFVGRKKELSVLEEFYNNPQIKAYAIIGRRQIGKSALIDEFIKDKENFKIEFLDSNLDKNLELMGRVMSSVTGIKKEYDSTMDFLWDLAEYIKGHKVVVVFDEFPYIVKCDESFAAQTQYFIDMQLDDSKLIISGSSIRTMEYETTDYSRPLYGRTKPLWLHQMSLQECMEFHKDLSDIDQLKLYMAIGGTPMYHAVPKFDSFQEYVEKMILGPHALFRTEGEDMIRREMDHADDIISILDSITGRNTTIKTIVSKTGIDRNACSNYVNALKTLGMISENNPMWGSPKIPVQYSISDYMLSFCYLVKRNDVLNNVDVTDRYKALNSLISTSRGFMFEQFCMDLITRSYPVRSIGKWWGSKIEVDEFDNVVLDNDNRPLTTKCDIDIAAEIMVGNNLVNLAVECKFKNNPVGFEALNELNSSIECLKLKRYTRRMIISPSGFTEDLIDYSIENNILLVGLNMILGKEPMPDI